MVQESTIIGRPSIPRTLIDDAISFTTSAGDDFKPVSVPDGEVWEIQSLIAIHAEGTAIDGQFTFSNVAGSHRGGFGSYGINRVSMPQNTDLAWNGSILLGPGWEFGLRLYGATGGASASWRYTAFKYDIV